MPNYIRRRVPGGTFFFTVALAPGSGISLIDHLDKLRAAYRLTIADHPVQTDAIVVLSDHLHAVWTLPPGDIDYSLRWRLIKGRFSHFVGAPGRRTPSHQARGEAGHWQRRFWEHEIRGNADFDLHHAYTLSDPVRHGQVQRAADWTASSIHRDLREGRQIPHLPNPLPAGMCFGEQAPDPVLVPA